MQARTSGGITHSIEALGSGLQVSPAALHGPPRPTLHALLPQFRNAATGELLAETEDMGAVFGIWHAPGYGGSFYYWSYNQVIYHLFIGWGACFL